MANEENLIPNSQRTPEELREMCSKGGKKSGESRKRKKQMKQIMDIADSGKIMPPKATWFEPKLRSGLVIHKLS